MLSIILHHLNFFSFAIVNIYRCIIIFGGNGADWWINMVLFLWMIFRIHPIFAVLNNWHWKTLGLRSNKKKHFKPFNTLYFKRMYIILHFNPCINQVMDSNQQKNKMIIKVNHPHKRSHCQTADTSISDQNSKIWFIFKIHVSQHFYSSLPVVSNLYLPYLYKYAYKICYIWLKDESKI